MYQSVYSSFHFYPETVRCDSYPLILPTSPSITGAICLASIDVSKFALLIGIFTLGMQKQRLLINFTKIIMMAS